MKRIFFLLVLSGLPVAVSPAEKRDLLQKEAGKINLAESLVKNFSELDFPTYNNRNFWERLPEKMRKEYIRMAEEYTDYDWPAVKATDYLEIIRSGDRRQEAYAAPRAALTALVMGELIEGKGRFTDQIVNGTWYYCEQTWWGWSAHLTLQKAPNGLPDPDEPVIDLGVGEITNILSWTWYLFKEEFDKIHPLISKRLKNEIMKKAVIPYYERNDFWWQGLDRDRSVNNWNPWTNHNMLTAILILEDNQAKKTEGVEKVIRSLDVFINGYPDDGGCDEGPSYWGRAGASLFQNLDLLNRATKGRFNVFNNQLIKNMGSYIYKTYIHYPYYVNFADADAKMWPPSSIIYCYGKAIGDPVMEKFGAFLARKEDWGNKPVGGKVDEQIMQLMYLGEIENAVAEEPLISDFWLPETEVAGARDTIGSWRGFFFAAKGGHNAESHNHNDVGSCVMYFNGNPCLVDIGRETYTAKTFSSSRYEIWTMQSQYHNLPKINGVDQAPGRGFKAANTTFKADPAKVVFSTDIAAAYPAGAAVKTWIRSYQLDRRKRFIIKDNYELSEIKNSPTTINFVTSCEVTQIKSGLLQLKGDSFSLNMIYNPNVVSPIIEYTKITDKGLSRYWEGINRIVFTVLNQKKKGENVIVITKEK